MQIANLMLHCGGQHVSYEELDVIDTPVGTSSWHPMPHSEVFNIALESLYNNGYEIVRTEHAVSGKDGANYFGLIQVFANYLDSPEYGLVVGLRNSHAKTFAAGMVAGAQVFICDNLAFSGEIDFKHKHTKYLNFQFPSLVNEGVGRLTSMYLNQEKRYNAYKEHQFYLKDVEKLVIDLFREGFINSSEIGNIIRIFDEPTYDEYGEDTAWTLFNAVTETMKSKLVRLPKTTMGLHNLLDAECREELLAA